jgi:hypothetical protein
MVLNADHVIAYVIKYTPNNTALWLDKRIMKLIATVRISLFCIEYLLYKRKLTQTDFIHNTTDE